MSHTHGCTVMLHIHYHEHTNAVYFDLVLRTPSCCHKWLIELQMWTISLLKVVWGLLKNRGIMKSFFINEC